MKKIGLFVVVLAIVSCTSTPLANKTVVSGIITNKLGNELTISNADGSIKETIRIASDGSFADTLQMKLGTYWMLDGKNAAQIYLETGNNIVVKYDANDFKSSLNFSGKGFETSQYLQAKSAKVSALMGKGTAVYLLEEAAYKEKFNEIKTAVSTLLKTSKGISKTYQAKEQKNINYFYLNKISIYQLYHRHYAKKPNFKISEGFLKDLEGLTFDREEDFLFSPSYKKMVTSHYMEASEALAKKETLAEDIAVLKVMATISNQTIKNSLLYDYAKYGVTYTEELETFYTLFLEASTNETHRAAIAKSYQKLRTVAKGEVSPVFKNYENYAGGTTSLTDLKGKYVYVDVWATWCGPCKAEIPYLKEIEKKYHKKNIAFVSVSVDKAKDHNKWKKMIVEKDLKGIQLFADKSWESDFVQGYLIKGIPRFILIDPNGNIINANAPRPSDPALKILFTEYGL